MPILIKFIKMSTLSVSDPKMRNYSQGQKKQEIVRKRTQLYVAQAITKMDT
jgi:hypothetical protein